MWLFRLLLYEKQISVRLLLLQHSTVPSSLLKPKDKGKGNIIFSDIIDTLVYNVLRTQSSPLPAGFVSMCVCVCVGGVSVCVYSHSPSDSQK